MSKKHKPLEKTNKLKSALIDKILDPINLNFLKTLVIYFVLY